MLRPAPSVTLLPRSPIVHGSESGSLHLICTYTEVSALKSQSVSWAACDNHWLFKLLRAFCKITGWALRHLCILREQCCCECFMKERLSSRISIKRLKLGMRRRSKLLLGGVNTGAEKGLMLFERPGGAFVRNEKEKMESQSLKHWKAMKTRRGSWSWMQEGEEQEAKIKGGHRFTVGVPWCDKFSVPYSPASGDKYHLPMVYVGLGQLSHGELFLTAHLCQLATGGGEALAPCML